MGETRVDLQHLLEDLRDAYPGSIEETILTEILANSLDSGATSIAFLTDPSQRTLTVIDDGYGMQRRELARYHDIASSSKTRGEGIGFAGVGIKLGLLVCAEVLTETRRGKSYVASSWFMSSRHRAPWKWVTPLGLLAERGTAVRLTLQNALSPLLDPGFLEVTLRRHFQSLLDAHFDEFLSAHYPKGVVIQINGRRLEKQHWSAPLSAPLEIRLLRRRKPSALGYLVRDNQPLAEERRGLAISTYGKVIRRGWDWLGLTPTGPEFIGGVIEVPELAACLTLNKGDFIRAGARGATYLGFRKAIQAAVGKLLAAWGDKRGINAEAPPREVRPLQRDLAQLLEELAIDFPLLGSLVEQRAGGQKRLPLAARGYNDDAHGFIAASISSTSESQDSPPVDISSSESESQTVNPAVNEAAEEFAGPNATIQITGKTTARRPAHYGLDIQFEDRPEDLTLGRLTESTVWVNRAHPAYRRAQVSHSIGYHIALAVAMALAPLAVEPAHQYGFIATFLSRWGEALDRPNGRKRRRR
jgi:histidine kinase/DNA gyrase B/HSP90-like ATPase